MNSFRRRPPQPFGSAGELGEPVTQEGGFGGAERERVPVCGGEGGVETEGSGG
ncbi:MAG: hypothetical protein JWM19_545 [Actinomycetia bacterium]|nr:hypothetical protein [Actinomycetes bacterium]